jgi:hypothetical protein
MRVHHFIALAPFVLFFICTYDHGVEVASDPPVEDPAGANGSSMAAEMLEFDIVQWTCALEVMARPTALQVPEVLNLTADDTQEPRDVDPGGTKLACT